MLIKTRFSFLITVFFIITVFLVLNIYRTNIAAKEVNEERTLINNALRSIFDMNILTNDLILKGNQRVVQQWSVNHENLKNEIELIFTSIDLNNIRAKQIKDKLDRDYLSLGASFSELSDFNISSELRDRTISNMILNSTDLVYLIFEYKEIILKDAAEVTRRHNSAVILGLVIILLMTLMAFYAFLQGVSKPLNTIVEDLKIIGKGNLNYKIRVNQKDEIGKLAQTFNEMTGNLQKITSSRDELNQEIEERKKMEKEREILMKKLEDSNSQLENFAYVASHDLQEPLRKINSFSELLVRHLGVSMDEKSLKYLNYITSGAVRMQRLITDLLEFSRISSRAKPFEMTDMNNALEKTIDELSLLIDQNDVKIEIDDLPEIKADEAQIRIVFHNLLTNAIKFKREENPEIKIAAEEKAESWIFSVSDNGIGIDKQFSEKVFVIFQRLHAREEFPGTGIGLALCKKVVERHRGNIWFESEVGKGTTFYIEIPKNLK